MDTVKFDIALSRYPPRRTPTPASATVPGSNQVKLDRKQSPNKAGDGDFKVPGIISTSLPTQLSPSTTDQKLDEPHATTLADRFHEWMEMDLEHGI